MLTKIKNLFKPIQENSDGYHTFDELYMHRYSLFLKLTEKHKEHAWWSLKHSDGSGYEGYFILGIFKEEGKQITYHLPVQYLPMVNEDIEELDFGPKYDGHTSADVIERILELC